MQSALSVALILTPFAALATPFSMDQFERVGNNDSFSVPLSLTGGYVTGVSYSGYVEVLVSGVGVGAPDENGTVDAFYTVDALTGISRGLNNNTLRVGSERVLESLPSGASFLPLDSRHFEAGSVHVAELAVAYSGDSFAVAGYDPLDINSGFAPVYNYDHVYAFIIDLGQYSGRLALGVGDGGTYDNSGNYLISMWQARLKDVASVPEPGTLALFGAGLLAICVGRRRCRETDCCKSEGHVDGVVPLAQGILRRLIRLSLVLGAMVAAQAYAIPISFSFSGHVTDISDSNGALGGSFTVGDPYSGWLTYESSAYDVDASGASGLYFSSAAPSGMGVAINGYVFQTQPLSFSLYVQTLDQAGQDLFDVHGSGLLIPPTFSFGDADTQDAGLYFVLIDNSGTVLASDHLPVLLDLSAWTSASFSITVVDSASQSRFYTISGPLDSLARVPAPVSEPGALFLLSAGVLVAGVARRWRDRAA